MSGRRTVVITDVLQFRHSDKVESTREGFYNFIKGDPVVGSLVVQ